MADLAPIEILRVRIGLEPDDDSQDVQLEAAFATSLAVVETYLDRKLALDTDTETYYGYGPTILVRRWPITDGTVLVNWYNNQNYVPDVMHVDNQRGIINAAAFGAGYPVTVTWEGGFDTLPPDLFWAMMSTFDTVWASTPGWGGIIGNVSTGSGEIKKVTLVGIGSVEMDVGTSSSSSGGGSAGPDVSPWGLLNVNVTSILDRYRRESVIGVG